VEDTALDHVDGGISDHFGGGGAEGKKKGKKKTGGRASMTTPQQPVGRVWLYHWGKRKGCQRRVTEPAKLPVNQRVLCTGSWVARTKKKKKREREEKGDCDQNLAQKIRRG